MTHVVVVGGGIAGLACAYELTSPVGSTPPAVTLLEPDELGGKLRCAKLGDQLVDVGPDGFLARRPEATALVHELGAQDHLEPVGAMGAWIAVGGRLHRLPPGLALGVPTRLGDLRTRTAVGVLGVRGAARAALDLAVPRRARRSALRDRAIGPLVADKLGRRVVERLVDPLVGGIHAGRVRDLSAEAIFPPLLVAAQRRGSLMRALQHGGDGTAGATGPAFLTLRDGLGTLPDLVVGALLARGVQHRAVPGVHLVREGHAWRVETADGAVDADAVVLATPADVTAALLAPHDAEAAVLLRTIDTASVATVTLRYDADDVTLPDGGTGVLVPSPPPVRQDAPMVTAITFLDRKWPHLAREGSLLLRASVGRIDDLRFVDLDDATLCERVHEELAATLDVRAAPSESLVTRWPGAFPQYRVNHLARVEAVEAAVRALGGLAVCGASFRGVGIPACIGSGRGAARTVRSGFARQS